MCVKNRYPKWHPGKRKQRLKPAVLWWFNFDPHPYVVFLQETKNKWRIRSTFYSGGSNSFS